MEGCFNNFTFLLGGEAAEQKGFKGAKLWFFQWKNQNFAPLKSPCRAAAGSETKCKVIFLAFLSLKKTCFMWIKFVKYLMEFKLEESAENTIQQIKQRKYAAAYKNSPKNIYLVGINFSKEERNIANWKAEIWDSIN